jgi:hypothetical protein
MSFLRRNPGSPVNVDSANVTGWEGKVNSLIQMNKTALSRAFSHQSVLFVLNEEGEIFFTQMQVMTLTRTDLGGKGVRAVVSKRGVDDGNQKGGGSFQPAKKNHFIYIKKNSNCKEKNSKF